MLRRNGVCYETECLAVGIFGPEGGRLKLAGNKIILDIPHGALTDSQTIHIYIQDKPEPNSSPAYCFSPVVQCGPNNLQFEVSLQFFNNPFITNLQESYLLPKPQILTAFPTFLKFSNPALTYLFSRKR